MKNYEILSPVLHDGDDYDVGEIVTLNDDDASALLALGAIAELGDTVTGDGSGEALPAFDEVVNGLVETLYAVFGDGEKAEKKPNVDDVRKWAEDASITTEQRDQAWELYLAMPAKGEDA